MFTGAVEDLHFNGESRRQWTNQPPIVVNKRPAVAVCTLLFALCALSASPRSEAWSCAVVYSTLADDYANALGIVVAQVDGCAGGGPLINGLCPDLRYHLNVLEVLKDAVPTQDFSGSYQGADFASCGTVLIPGESYLLFISSDGSFNHSASGALKGKTPQTRQLQQHLGILRDYRDGKIDDLAGRWLFSDNSLSCNLQHRVADQFIQFVYPYFEGAFASYSLETDYDADGYATHTAVVSDFQSKLEIEYERDGPEVAYANTLWFRATFDRKTKTVRDSATVQVGPRSWKLASNTMTIRTRDADTQTAVTEVAWGETADEILQAMLKPTTVVVRAQTVNEIASVPATESGLDVSIETRTTQIADEAAHFLACVDGTKRRGPPDGL